MEVTQNGVSGAPTVVRRAAEDSKHARELVQILYHLKVATIVTTWAQLKASARAIYSPVEVIRGDDNIHLSHSRMED